MKKTFLITLIIGILVIVFVYFLVPEDSIDSLFFLYVYYPLTLLLTNYRFKAANDKDHAWHASVIMSPFYVNLLGGIFLQSLPDFVKIWVFASPLVTILISVIILEYYIYDLIL